MSYLATTALNQSLAGQGRTIFPFAVFTAISHAVTGETQTTCALEIAKRADLERLRLPDASQSNAHVSSSNESVIHRLPVRRFVLEQVALDLDLRKQRILVKPPLLGAWYNLGNRMPVAHNGHHRAIFAHKR